MMCSVKHKYIFTAFSLAVSNFFILTAHHLEVQLSLVSNSHKYFINDAHLRSVHTITYHHTSATLKSSCYARLVKINSTSDFTTGSACIPAQSSVTLEYEVVRAQ